MTIPDPTYITKEEVAAQTLITGLAALGPDIDKLISIAEGQIDAYCGPQAHHPWDTNIDRVFPREEDYNIVGTTSGPVHYRNTPVIPLEISVATLRQVEWLYTQWWPNRATALPQSDRPVEQESISGDGGWSGTYAKGGVDFSQASICEQARGLLERFRSRTASISVTKPDDVVPHL